MKFNKLTTALIALTIGSCGIVSAQTFTTLFSFNSSNTGSFPLGRLTQGPDGNLYGTTVEGGINQAGTIFKITPGGVLSVLYLFSGPDGAEPNGALTLGDDGELYGATGTGGANGSGTIFKITPDGVLTTLHNFDGFDGVAPLGGLVLMDGVFYGTAFSDDNGTAFAITPSGQFTSLHQFGTDNFTPSSPLALRFDGNLYGVGQSGENDGVLFVMTTSGVVRVLHTFTGSDGVDPQGPLTLGNDGNFYGETMAGGTGSGAMGTVFRMTPSGTVTTLHTFGASGLAGTQPGGGLLVGSDGALYGITEANAGGKVFRISAGVVTVLASLGPNPSGDTLVQDTNGTFYGTTSGGGANSDGSVFSLSTGLAPFVTLSPSAGNAGTNVVILSQGLTGATAVSFNGAPASFQINSDHLIEAQVPTGATTGKVVVTTSTGTLSSNSVFEVAN